MASSHRILWTRIFHRRHRAPEHGFHYRAFSLLIDVDDIGGLAKRSRLFGFNKAHLLSFHERDHGPRDGTPLRPWIDALLDRQGVDCRQGRVLLLCMPRVLGYAFNPLSLWFCHSADGELRAVLFEVHNTFGESHSYLLHRGGEVLAEPVRMRGEKCFHVSPFFPVDGEYQFSIRRTAKSLVVGVVLSREGRRALSALQAGSLAELTDRALLRALLRLPFTGLKVTAAIHWQALKLWLRGAAVHAKPQAPSHEVSSCTTQN